MVIDRALFFSPFSKVNHLAPHKKTSELNSIPKEAKYYRVSSSK
jgi:hypothetical protein